MNILASLHSILSWVGPFLIVLTILVFIHELGHYLVARFNGVKIEIFSIGFGPEAFGWTDRHGTRWKISWIPLGGYVQMFGDADASSRPDADHQEKMSASEKHLTLNGKTVWQRMAVSAAGPFANILLTLIFLGIIFQFQGQQTVEPIIGSIRQESAAEKAGFLAGDKVLSINNQKIETFKQLQAIVSKKAGVKINVEIERGGQTIVSELIPDSQTLTPTTTIGILGITPKLIRHNLGTAILASFKTLGRMSIEMITFLGGILFAKEDASKLGSIMSIAKMSKDSLEGGIFSLLSFMAILSLNLGIINLFPVPALDGGHLLFYMIEAIRGKPIGLKGQEIAFKVGFGLLGLLMLFTLWNDLIRFNIVQKGIEIGHKLFSILF